MARARPGSRACRPCHCEPSRRSGLDGESDARRNPDVIIIAVAKVAAVLAFAWHDCIIYFYKSTVLGFAQPCPWWTGCGARYHPCKPERHGSLCHRILSNRLLSAGRNACTVPGDRTLRDDRRSRVESVQFHVAPGAPRRHYRIFSGSRLRPVRAPGLGVYKRPAGHSAIMLDARARSGSAFCPQTLPMFDITLGKQLAQTDDACRREDQLFFLWRKLERLDVNERRIGAGEGR